MTALRSRAWPRDAGLAVALAALLTAAWAVVHWAQLSALWLPDTDDVVRLQQIRDWLGGQPFGTVAQARMGLAGVPMHWSRLPDLVPAAIILALTPLTGVHVAELAAVIIWPGLLFAGVLLLVARLARRLGAGAIDAMLLAALAYPATTLFQPGRIDHHGLQLLLLLVVARALLSRRGAAAGALAGLATAASLVIGMETAPLLAAAAALLLARWVKGRPADDAKLAAFAFALAAALLAAGLWLRTDGWRWPACDGFTATAWTAQLIGTGWLLLLVAVGRATREARLRLAAAALLGLAALTTVALLSPACASPYGAVDPLVARLWLARVGEAQPLLAADPRWALSYAGVMVVGLAATLWLWGSLRSADLLILLVLQLAALAVTLVQLRGAYAGAMLAIPALAVMVGAARRRGPLWVVQAWLVSAGISYPLAAGALPGSAPGPERCETPALLARLAALPPGRVLAPIDLGARLIAGSRHVALAAPYHRNDAGNRLLYRFLLSPPARGQAMLAAARVDYVVACPGARLPRTMRPGSTAALLASGIAPAWLEPVAPGIYRVVRIAARN